MAKTARLWAAALAMTGLAASAASLPACSSSTPGAVSGPCGPGEKACEVSLTILHTSDIHSRLFPYEQVITQVDATLGLGELNSIANIGGVGRMSYVLQRERARAGRVIHLDSGDCFQGAPIFNFFRGEPEVRSMDALGVDAAVVGNHEFDYGAQNVATQFQRWSNFALLSANYRYDPMDYNVPSYGRVGTVAKPFTVLNAGGLKIAVIGMANLSSITSIFDAPNRLGITPLNTAEVVQFYVDLLRPYVDLVGAVSHMGLEVDQRVVRNTSGLDFIMGGHNHVVINPPQEIKDCTADQADPGYIWEVNPKADVDLGTKAPDDPDPALRGRAGNFDPELHPYKFKRACRPRRVMIVHSGAFAKYVGRLDTTVSNRPELASPDGDPANYDPLNGFEILSTRYQAIPITADVPEDPVIVDMLQPYRRALANLVDLDILVGYSPNGSRRIATTGGDSPLGNMVATSIWLRLGVQTDFSLTNSTGIRTDLNPGPITVEQMYNIFPFDNSITKMQLSGLEVQELFDFATKRSASRGCASQIQIAGARIRMNCTGCDRLAVPCEDDATCQAAGRDGCDQATKRCFFRCEKNEDCQLKKGGTCDTIRGQCEITSCAEQVYIGNNGTRCQADEECVAPGEKVNPGQCDKSGGTGTGLCMALIRDINRYELATSNYLAGGGSGFRVLQRNTTQFDTKIQQRDALLDYMRSGRPCLWSAKNATPDGLQACSVDADCGNADAVCSCARGVSLKGNVCETTSDCGGTGRCVLRDCRDGVAKFHLKRCADAPNQESCLEEVGACQLAGETCKVLTCIDANLGSKSDGRVEMIGR
jgi:5'-nucleotidase